MAIETVTFDGSGERKLLIGMITSPRFIIGIRNALAPETIQSKYVRKLCEWCLAYYEKYDQPPGPDIEDLLKTSQDEGTLDEGDAKAMLRLLKSLDSEFSNLRFNVDHYLTGARKYLRECRVKSLKALIDSCLLGSDIEKAEHAITSFSKRSGETSAATSFFDDTDGMIKTFGGVEEKEYLIQFPGAIGELLNEFFVRDSLLVIQAGPKTGKTFLLDEISYRGYKSRCNVALFQAGDLSEEQQRRRLAIRMCQRSDLEKYCKSRWEPVPDCKHNKDDSCGEDYRACSFKPGDKTPEESFFDWVKRNRNYVPCTACRKSEPQKYQPEVWWVRSDPVEPIILRDVLRCMDTMKRGIRGKKLMVDCHPTQTLTISKMNSILDEWEVSSGFVPDVVIVDYADILKDEPEWSRMDKRLREDAKYAALRKMSSDRHICLVVGTQGKDLMDGKELQDRNDFTESKNKYHHATGVFTINRTDEEEIQGLARIAPLMVRDGECDKTKSVRLLQKLHKGLAMCDSHWKSEGKRKLSPKKSGKSFKQRSPE